MLDKALILSFWVGSYGLAYVISEIILRLCFGPIRMVNVSRLLIILPLVSVCLFEYGFQKWTSGLLQELFLIVPLAVSGLVTRLVLWGASQYLFIPHNLETELQWMAVILANTAFSLSLWWFWPQPRGWWV